MFLEQQHRTNGNTNRPEIYELAENGFLDRAIEFLGWGRWCIGRPRLGNGNGLSAFRPKNNRTGRLSISVERPFVASTPTTQPLVTDLFLKHIPSPGALRKAYSEWANSIEYRNLLVVGDQSSGKTTLVQRLAEDLAEWYKPFAIESWIQTGGLAQLLIHGTRNKAKAWFLVGEDLTLVRVPRSHVNAFFTVRNIIRLQTGLNEGLAVTVFNSHTLLGIDKNLRTTFRMMFLKTIPTNPYNRSLLKKYFDADLLEWFEREGTDSDVLVWDKYHQSGVWAKVPLPAKNLLKQVPPLPKARLSLLSSGLILMTIIFVLVMLASVLPRLLLVRGG